jgi:hypothetical protein
MNRFMTVMTLVLCVAACGDAAPPQPQSQPADAPAAQVRTGASAQCLVGTWAMEEAGVARSFTFNADHTGEEIQSPTEVRPFAWSLEDEETVRIIYTAHGDVQSSEWDLELSCAENRLSFYGADYSRRPE